MLGLAGALGAEDLSGAAPDNPLPSYIVVLAKQPVQVLSRSVNAPYRARLADLQEQARLPGQRGRSHLSPAPG